MNTLFCCYNDEKQLNEYLLTSLKRIYGDKIAISDSFAVETCYVDKDIEVLCITIDNRKRRYSGCASAYEDTVDRWKDIAGEIFYFVHQDIFFLSSAFFDEVQSILSKDKNIICGSAGMPEEGRTISNLRYLKDKSYITQTRVKKTCSVFSLDECCFALNRDLYFRTLFDTKTCNGWHLYAVDFCYNAMVKWNARSLVLQSSDEVCHKYDGTSGLYGDNQFLFTMIKMMWKYRKHVRKIYSPCLIVDISLVKGGLRIARSWVKNLLR